MPTVSVRISFWQGKGENVSLVKSFIGMEIMLCCGVFMPGDATGTQRREREIGKRRHLSNPIILIFVLFLVLDLVPVLVHLLDILLFPVIVLIRVFNIALVNSDTTCGYW